MVNHQEAKEIVQRKDTLDARSQQLATMLSEIDETYRKVHISVDSFGTTLPKEYKGKLRDLLQEVKDETDKERRAISMQIDEWT